MAKIFLHILNMSISAGYLVLAIVVLRLLLKKAPKWINVLLWGLVAVRLICPFTVESAFSLLPKAQTVNPDILDQSASATGGTMIPSVGGNLPPVTEVEPVLPPAVEIAPVLPPAVTEAPSALETWISALAVVWAIGALFLIAYMIFSYCRIMKKVNTAVLAGDRVYQSENVSSAFVLGIFSPKIYLPFSMNERSMTHVIAHERAHIRRKDHLWKPLGFLLLSVYWFNPLMWVGYVLLCRDIELACDEKVIGELGRRERAEYSEVLLSCSVNRRMISACPLAFGEINMKGRVRSVLNYKKPALWIVCVAMVVCVGVALGFLTNPASAVDAPADMNEGESTLDGVFLPDDPSQPINDPDIDYDLYVWQMAENNYNFCLLFHSLSERDQWDLWALPASDLTVIQARMQKLGIEKEQAQIIPIPKVVSSYIGEYWIRRENESDEEFLAKRQAYVENIRNMVFANLPEVKYDLYVKDCVTETDRGFYLVPHVDDRPFEELISPAFVSLSVLREQIEEYGLQKEDIRVTVWQSPLSSTFGEYWGRKEGESDLQWLDRQEKTIDGIYGMVFATE